MTTIRPHLLVLDNDGDSCRLFKSRLKNCEVTLAENCSDAMTILATCKSINMLLIDYCMINVDGINLIRTIRDKYKILIVMITTDIDSEKLKAASRIGISYYINRRIIDFMLIEQSLQTVLDRHNSKNEPINIGNLLCQIDDIYKEKLRDMALAKKIQQEYLMNLVQCRKTFAESGMGFSVRYQAPLEISGDFFYAKNNGKAYSLILGDTAGHGLSAALQSIRIHSFLEKIQPPTRHPSETMETINTKAKNGMALNNNEISNAIALMIAVFNGEKVFISNGAQPYPLLLSKRKEMVEEMQIAGFPVGICLSKQWEEVSYDWQPGDVFLAYTDGLIDAMNHKQEPYGRQRLLDCIDKNIGRTCDELVQNIMYDVDVWRDEVPLPDDITIVAVENVNA
ncbi:MAG: fused response regulator/phosphatase [Nitrospirae bacterium]|nr:fused response regulator/phosphatase [Nitrospirota bacterium]